MTRQARPKQSSRRQRNANVISPFDRIKAIYGLEYIKRRFEETLAKARDVTTNLALGDYHQTTDDNLKLVGKPIVSAPFTCKVRGNDKMTYPTIKFRLAHHMAKLKEIFGEEQDQYDQSSVPLDLHRLAACREADWNISLLKMHAIHRCHRKECFEPSHLYFGTVDQNRSTDFCPAYANINGTLVSICAHKPKCLVHGARSAHHH